MSLNWSIENCAEGPEILRGEGREWYITETLIWATMAVDLPGITEDNAAEFYARFHLWEQTFGAMTTLNYEPYFITPEDVRRRIGLSANVSPKTTAAWIKHFGQRAMDEHKASFARHMERTVQA